MIDIHSHILYGVDDGCKTIEDSIEIIASKVHELEQANFPKVIQNLLNKDLYRFYYL